jgi:hypothetical protein
VAHLERVLQVLIGLVLVLLISAVVYLVFIEEGPSAPPSYSESVVN